MVLVGEAVQDADALEQTLVLGPHGGEQDGDAPVLEVGDEVGERLRPGGVEQLQPAEAQDHDLDVG